MASGSTPTYLIPYPLPTDPVNVASDMEEMADRLEILFGTTVQAATANTFTNTNIFSVNSASTAVRITQVGSGNALLVEDDSNPDTSAFVVTNAGDVGIGKLSPGEKLDVAGNIKLTGNLIFEGASEDAHELTFAYTNPTTDRTITFPDVTGTVITDGNLTSITAVGTITSGTWLGGVITAASGGTGISSYGVGSILYASASNALTALNIGTSGQILTVSAGGIPQWAAAPITLPSQTGQNGKFLTTDGSTASWATIPVTAAATPTVAGTVFGYTDAVGSNVGFGYNALGTQVASNDQHVAIGYETLQTIASTAFADVMVGFRSGYGVTTGDYNIGIGGFNFWGTTTGNYNIAIGYEALPGWSGQTGSYNIFIGYQSGYNASPSISSTVAVGNNTLYAFSGNNVTAVGESALYYNTSGSDNTAIGQSAGSNVTTGSQNTLLGSFAGNDWSGSNIDLTTGSNNIIIGYQSAPTASSVSNEITIGNASNNRFRVPGLGIDWTSATVPTGGGGDARPQIFMLMGA